MEGIIIMESQDQESLHQEFEKQYQVIKCIQEAAIKLEELNQIMDGNSFSNYLFSLDPNYILDNENLSNWEYIQIEKKYNQVYKDTKQAFQEFGKSLEYLGWSSSSLYC